MNRAGPHPVGSEVMLASAGTGKTYQLTSRFLRLMAADAEPDSILATTFTRKAAGEVFDRMARRLLSGCGEGADAAEALADLRRDVDPSIESDACVRMLAMVAARMHRLNIRTIDSFFVQAALVLAFELDLTPGWRIVEDDEDREIRCEAIDRVLARGDRDRLVDLIRLLHGGQFARSVHEAVLRVIDDAYPVYLDSIDRPEVWRVVAPETPPLDDEAIGRLIERLERAPIPQKGSGEPDSRWSNAVEKSISLARDGNWEAFVSSGLGGKLAAGASTYYDKEFTGELLEAIEPMIDHAGAVLLEQLDQRNEATRDLLAGFDREYRSIKRDQGLFRFDDIPRLLLERTRADELDDLYYRMDGRVTHLLLDEFQDTSITQFELLRPLLDELLAHAESQRSVFCVGDVKQSLYGWRGAEPELLRRLHRIWPQLGEPTTLDRSYRSSPVVLSAVNGVFSGIADNRGVEPASAGASWASRFRSHIPADRVKDLPGEVRLSVGPKVPGKTKEVRQALIEYAAARIKSLLTRAPRASVGVLVRKRNRIPHIIQALRRLEIDASEEAGNPVNDTPSVGAAVSLLWLADHPGDTAALYHVATSPIGVAVGLTEPGDRAAGERLGADLRRRLSRDGYASTLSAILHDCAESLDARGFGRFCQLIDLAQRYDEHAGTRPSDFVRLVRARPVEEPGRRPVRVMTIHASKGLEFDAVILPDLEDRWTLKNHDMLVERSDPIGPIEGISRSVRKEVRRLSDRLTHMYDAQLARGVEEQLCTLYVAMTRAIHALEMIIAPRDGADPPPSAAGVLCDALAPGVIPEPQTDLWTESRGDWAAHLALHARDTAPASPERVELTVRRPTHVHAGRLRRRAPSSMEGGSRLDLADVLRVPESRALERGTLLHAWFRTVEWIEDYAPDEDELLAIAGREDVEPAVARALMPAFREAISTDAVRSTLSRARYESWREGDRRLEVRREFSFVVRDHDPESGQPWLLNGQFDRLVIAWDASEPVRADVIDYKTDDLAHDDLLGLAARVDYYRPQVESYRRAAATMLGLAPGLVTARIIFTSCDRVIEIG